MISFTFATIHSFECCCIHAHSRASGKINAYENHNNKLSLTAWTICTTTTTKTYDDEMRRVRERIIKIVFPAAKSAIYATIMERVLYAIIK